LIQIARVLLWQIGQEKETSNHVGLEALRKEGASGLKVIWRLRQGAAALSARVSWEEVGRSGNV
jgi:hypothetical protein